jgi:hypothetical protein
MPAVAIVAAGFSVSAGVALGIGTLAGGLMVAGGVMTGLGAITGNDKLSKLGAIASLGGGLAGLASGATSGLSSGLSGASSGTAAEAAVIGADAYGSGMASGFSSAPLTASGSTIGLSTPGLSELGDAQGAFSSAAASGQAASAVAAPFKSQPLLNSTSAPIDYGLRAPAPGANLSDFGGNYSSPMGRAPGGLIGNSQAMGDRVNMLGGGLKAPGESYFSPAYTQSTTDLALDGSNGSFAQKAMAFLKDNPELVKAGSGLIGGATKSYDEQKALEYQKKLQAENRARYNQSILSQYR